MRRGTRRVPFLRTPSSLTPLGRYIRRAWDLAGSRTSGSRFAERFAENSQATACLTSQPSISFFNQPHSLIIALPSSPHEAIVLNTSMWTTNLALLVWLLLCVCVQAALADQQQQQPTFVYTFDPASAAGICGTIRVTYDSPESSRATLSADLDFASVDISGIKSLDANCSSPPVEYQWHIHTKWSFPSPSTSASFARCAKTVTGNHYDPLRACGPNSEFAETPECEPNTPVYACTPVRYAADPLVCEKGDLSGKLGSLKVDQSTKRVVGTWVDEHFPLVVEISPQWNIILHAVCGSATPRVACALAQRIEATEARASCN